MRTPWLVGVLAAGIFLPAMAFAASSAKCGGGGGSTSTRSCPNGSYVVGITARGGAFVDRFGIQCASFTSKGKRNPVGGFKVVGSGGGSTTGSDQCGGNQAVTSITTRAGAFVDRISGGLCGNRTGSNGFAPFDPNLNGSDLAMSVGGSGGSPCDLQCAEGEAVVKIRVRHGAWIDSIQIGCKP